MLNYLKMAGQKRLWAAKIRVSQMTSRAFSSA